MKTAQFCMNIIADFLNQRETFVGETDLDWKEIAAIFKKHEMSGVLYTQCARFLPDPIKSELYRQYYELYFIIWVSALVSRPQEIVLCPEKCTGTVVE